LSRSESFKAAGRAVSELDVPVELAVEIHAINPLALGVVSELNSLFATSEGRKQIVKIRHELEAIVGDYLPSGKKAGSRSLALTRLSTAHTRCHEPRRH
jgi:hypothetical protein